MKPNNAVSKSMAVLIDKAGTFGAPRLDGRDSVDGKDVPGLYFGATKMNKFFDVVDEVVKESGGTATLFVKAGAEYVRIATNVKKEDGSRAVGTILDPSGPPIEKIKKGEAYYGEANLNGRPAPPPAYAELLERARSIAENDDDALCRLAQDAARAGLSGERLDQLSLGSRIVTGRGGSLSFCPGERLTRSRDEFFGEPRRA
jgi:hypothetical protein